VCFLPLNNQQKRILLEATFKTIIPLYLIAVDNVFDAGVFPVPQPYRKKNKNRLVVYGLLT